MQERRPIDVEEALNKIEQYARQGETETVTLFEAHGRYLAEDLIADHPIPFFDRSSFDGFAVKSSDILAASPSNRVTLKVIEAIGAGDVPKKVIQSGEALRIMTGAQMPEGADTVIPIEQVTEIIDKDESFIEITSASSPGSNIAFKGEDVKEGTILSPKGTRISAGEMAMLATFGYARVTVYKQPTVGIFVTGTELLEVDAPLEPGKIRNSNSYMLVSQIMNAGAIPKYYGILPDKYLLCLESVQNALKEVDFLITTGGASVGDFDFVQDILQELQANILFNKVAMRPGSVTTVATWRQKWIFGLSGNPAACFVGFELFTRPVLKTALGAITMHLPRAKAVIQHDINVGNSFVRFMRAKAEIMEHRVLVSAIGLDKSSIISALVESNALIYIPKNTENVEKGEMVEIIWLAEK